MDYIEETNYYPGFRIFEGLSNTTGIALDQINFIVSQLGLLVFASILRTHLHPSKTKASIRHWFELTVGLLAGSFCFGSHVLHILALPGVCYVVMLKMDPNKMQRVCLAISLVYLSSLHLYRQFYDYGSSNLDITGPIMIITQKITSLAFSLHDGKTKTQESMNKNQKLEVITEAPSLLAYFSYCLSFQTLMAGPSISFKYYMDFIEGKSDPAAVSKKTDNASEKEPSPLYHVLYKILTAAVCGLLFIICGSNFSVGALKDARFLVEAAIPYKFWFMYLCLLVCRLKYYFAWMFADAICNSSGMGFNGYTEDGKEKWDAVSNVDIWAFETGTNMKEIIDAWNMRTNFWLRTVAYERSKKYPTFMTFGLSALWHGFYPGYYITFASGALFTAAARTGRRHIRHFFLKSTELKAFYDVVTVIITRLVITYITFPFVLLELGPSLQIYMRLYWCLHILGVGLWAFGPFIIPKLNNQPNQRNPGNVNVNQIENTLRQVGPITNSSS